MQRSVRREILSKLVAERILSPEGRDWLIEACDPFHDELVTLTGYPDTNVSGSIVQCVKQTQTIGASASLTPDTNWDCHIVLWNNPKQVTDASGNLKLVSPVEKNAILQVGTTNIKKNPIGGVTAVQTDSGQPTYGAASAVTAWDSSTCTLSIDPTYQVGTSRVVAMGLEVVNTTAPLYRQGQVAAYRQPTPSMYSQYTAFYESATPQDIDRSCESKRGSRECSRETHRLGALPADYGWCSTYTMTQPPQTLAQAMLLDGTRTWAAEDGVYLVATLNALENPAKVMTPCVFQQAVADMSGSATYADAVSIGPIWNATNFLYAAANVQILPYTMSGAYFTGLSPQTTLQVSVVWYIERFPTPLDTNLVVLASPSPCFDPIALEIYGHAMSRLPVGVKQGDNPLGEWFRDVVGRIARFVAPPLRVASDFFPALAPIAGGAEIVGEYMQPSRKKKKKRQKQVSKVAPKPRVIPVVPVRQMTAKAAPGNSGMPRRTKTRALKGQ